MFYSSIQSVFSFSKPLIALVVITIYADVLYQVPVIHSLLFALAVFLVFFVPGDLVLSTINIELPFDGSRYIYSTALGLMIVTIAYTLWRHSGLNPQYLYFPFVGTTIFWISLGRLRRPYGKSINFTGTDFYPLCILIVLILVLLHFTHFSDVLLVNNGFDLRISPNTETIFHQGLVNALSDNYPPAALYASEITDYSFYHFGMHLQIEIIHRLFGIPTIELIYYYFSFFYFFLISALSYSLVRSIGGNSISAVLAGAIVFGSDFSYIPGMVNGIEAPAIWDLIYIPGVFSLFTYNGIIPGYISLLISVILFNQYCKVFAFPTAVVLAVVVVSAYQIKYSMGLHLNLVLISVGILMLATSGYRKAGIMLVGIFSALILVVLVRQFYLTGDTGNIVVKIIPFNMFSSALERDGRLESPLYLKALLFFMYFVLALGVRYLGYHVLIRTKWNMKYSSWGTTFIFIFFLSGYSMSELFFLGVEGGYDNSIWFAVQGLFAAWILVFYFVIKTQESMKRQLWAVTAIAMLAFPSTIQLLFARDAGYLEFNGDDVEVVNFIKGTKPESIFLHPVGAEEPSLSSSLGGRSSVLNIYHSFIESFLISPAGEDVLSARYEDIELIFTENVRSEDKYSILKNYNVDYVYCRNSRNECENLEFLNNISLELRNEKYSVYSISL